MATISRDHPYLRATDFGQDAIAQLFDTGRIALFLDGLDEMPDMLRSKAVEQFTAEAAGRRLVITSRPDEFRETSDQGRRQLPYTAVIELRPVGPKAAAKYLLEGQIGATRQAWAPVADHLLAHPDGVLARTLNTPLTLSLARAAYARDDPGGLLTRISADEHALRVRLLDQVLVAAYPEPGERAHATFWLGWIANKMSTQPNGPVRDLRWWQIPGWIPRWQLGLVAYIVFGFVFGFLYGLPCGLIFGIAVGLVLPGLVAGIVVGLGSGILGGLVGWVLVRWGYQRVPPRSLTVRWDLRSGVWFAFVFPGGLGLLFGYAFAGPITGLVYGLGLGLGLGLVIELMVVWRVPLAATVDVTPRSTYQKDVQSQLLSGLALVLVFVVCFGLVGPALVDAGGLIVRFVYALVTGIVFGLWLGLQVGLLAVSSTSAASLLLFTELAVSRRGRRVRFMPLLESALQRQVLRQAGAVYQFRHADLQDRLAERYEAGMIGGPSA
jgi:hypothetical protein